MCTKNSACSFCLGLKHTLWLSTLLKKLLVYSTAGSTKHMIVQCFTGVLTNWDQNSGRASSWFKK
jgi:hypothetical protein